MFGVLGGLVFGGGGGGAKCLNVWVGVRFMSASVCEVYVCECVRAP